METVVSPYAWWIAAAVLGTGVILFFGDWS
jgi:hypothetical protein